MTCVCVCVFIVNCLVSLASSRPQNPFIMAGECFVRSKSFILLVVPLELPTKLNALSLHEQARTASSVRPL